jgi:hypothetical protein
VCVDSYKKDKYIHINRNRRYMIYMISIYTYKEAGGIDMINIYTYPETGGPPRTGASPCNHAVWKGIYIYYMYIHIYI